MGVKAVLCLTALVLATLWRWLASTRPHAVRSSEGEESADPRADRSWWFRHRGAATRDLIVTLLAGAVVGVPILFATAWLDDRRADQAQRLENLRFVRERAGDRTLPKPFSGLDLTGMSLRGLDLGCVDTRLPADTTPCNADRIANLSYAVLTEANLTDAHLSYANLEEANLGGATLYRTDFINAWMIRTRLNNTNLTYAQLNNALLGEADLSGSNLTGADFSGAAFLGIILHGVCWEGTPPRWPAGYNPPPNAGFRRETANTLSFARLSSFIRTHT